MEYIFSDRDIEACDAKESEGGVDQVELIFRGRHDSILLNSIDAGYLATVFGLDFVGDKSQD